MPATKHRDELRVMNVILSLFVVFIHVAAPTIADMDKLSPFFAAVFIPRRLVAIAVQGFIFLSGLKLFLNMPEKMDYKRFFLTRLKKIVVPYLVVTVIYLAYFIRYNYMTFSVTSLLRDFAFGSIVSPFYFVPLICQFYLLTPLWRKIFRDVPPIIYLVLSLLIMQLFGQFLPQMLSPIVSGFWFNDRVFTTFLFYWLLGCYIGSNYESVKSALKKHRPLIYTMYLITMLLEAVFNFLHFSGRQSFPFLEQLHYLYCISGIVALLTVTSALYENRRLKNRLMLEMNAASYYIFLFHALVIYNVNELMLTHGIYRLSHTFVLRVILVFAITIIVSIVYRNAGAILRRGLRRK